LELFWILRCNLQSNNQSLGSFLTVYKAAVLLYDDNKPADSPASLPPTQVMQQRHHIPGGQCQAQSASSGHLVDTLKNVTIDNVTGFICKDRQHYTCCLGE